MAGMTSLTKRQRFLVSFTLFGMFFGAGNLIFPVHLGQLVAKDSIYALLGFILTAVGIPILSVAAIGMTHSNSLQKLSSRIGQRYSYLFTVVLYLTIGPLFAIPRCASTSFTVGIAPILGQSVHERLALLVFSLIFFALVLYCSLRPAGITVWIGKIINPVFLICLCVLVVTVFLRTGMTAAPSVIEGRNTVLYGFTEGYQTMDAIAGLAFGIVVVNIVRSFGVEQDHTIAKEILYAGILTGLLMGGIYAVTILMGARSREVMDISENGGVALAQISGYYLGGAGKYILAVIIIFACLKTSIGLVTSCAAAFSEMFPDVLGYKAWALLFTGVSLGISNIGLSKIIAYSLPVLMFLYPLTIVLTLLALFERVFNQSRYVYVSVTIFTGLAAFLDFLKAFPFSQDSQSSVFFGKWIAIAEKYLPLYGVGIGWILPAAAGLLVGIILYITIEKGRTASR